MKNIIIDEKFSGIRLNKYLSKILINTNESFIYKMIRKKNILLNDKKADGRELIKDGDKISIFFKDETFDKFTKKIEKESNIPNDLIEKIEKNIIYEDINIIVIDKWDGIPCQFSKNFKYSIDSLTKEYLKRKNNTESSGIVNRIDTNTKGLVIFAKNYLSKKILSEQFANSNVEKKYIAEVCGIVENDNILKLYMKKDKNKNKVFAIDEFEYLNIKNKNDYYLTITEIKIIEYKNNNTILDVNLKTGKPHQIRASLSYIGHPIVGDEKYGNTVGDLKLISKNISFNNIENDKLKYLNNKIFMSNYVL